MGNATKVVAHFDNVIKVTHADGEIKDFDRVAFTYLKNSMLPNMQYVSLRDTEQLINNYDYKGKKASSPGFLKGIFEGYFDGESITQNSPYLFIDIDVENSDKKKENVHLFDIEKNEAVFKLLEKWSVFVWRSSSGTGIAGILYVPQLESFLFPKKDLHKEVGTAITNYLSHLIIKEIGIAVKFDSAQSRLRQVRFLAKQKVKRTLNSNPLKFTFDITQKQREVTTGVPAYKLAGGTATAGSIFDQFNQDNNILDVLLANGFTKVKGSRDRVKYINSSKSSTSSGSVDVDKNIYYNYSGSFGDKSVYNPSSLVCKVQFNSNWSDFAKYLGGLGYSSIQPSQDVITTAKKSLKEALPNALNETEIQKVIFENVEPLQLLNEKQKKNFVAEVCNNPKHAKYYNAYLGIRDLSIKYDKTLIVKNWISEQLPNILNYADEKKKVILCAETGLGKSTAILKDLLVQKPNARLLFVVPLVAILEQFRQEYPNAVCLDGNSTDLEKHEALANGLVIATYEQAIKILGKSYFDYVVIDEVHNLDVSINYKNNTIASLTLLLEKSKSKLIGLTGTPNSIFKMLGYKLLNIKKAIQAPTTVKVTYDNAKPYSIALSHISGLKPQSKALIMLNDTDGLHLLKDEAVQRFGYKKDEILILYSDAKIKNAKDFKQLTQKGKFDDKIKLVLTTSLINEGLSIRQKGFTDVVFIESSYNPRSEPIKQFFARFRNVDAGRTNYLYLKRKNDQDPKYFNPNRFYNGMLEDLQEFKTTTEFVELIEEYGKSKHSSVIGNESLYYETGDINKYYLANTTTSIFFNTLNTEQFREFLELNYNLVLNANINALELLGTAEHSGKKAINKTIAKLWLAYQDEILQEVKRNTQDVQLKKSILNLNIVIPTVVIEIVEKHLKSFETLAKRFNEVKSFGYDNPNEIIYNLEKGTLISNTKYNEWVILQKIYMTVKNPKTKADTRDKEKFIKFVRAVVKEKSFTNSWMQKEFRKLDMYNRKKLNQTTVISIIKAFNYDVKICKNTSMITVG